MKVTLEFEESDLREMLTSYFRGNGFAVKNLDEVCAKFKGAYVDGLKVQAEIMTTEPTNIQAVTPTDVPVEDVDVDTDTASDSHEPMLSLNDLTDPSPRGRVVSIANTKSEFADLISASKRIEQERRRT